MSTRLIRRAEQEKQRTLKALERMSGQACTIFLLRHGETDYNAVHRLQGQLNPGPPLNSTGIAQAEALGVRLRDENIAAIWSSDLLRACQTAKLIATQHHRPDVPMETDIGLRERGLGCLEDLMYSEAGILQPEAFQALIRGGRNTEIPGGGESVDQLSKRVTTTLESLATKYPGQTVAVVSHGGVMHAAFYRCVERSNSSVPNCAVNIIRIDPTQRPCSWAVVEWGDVTHLEALETADAGFGGDQMGG